MDEYVGRSRLLAPAGQAVRLPVAYLVCNQTRPVGDQPSLMSFTELRTLFHEFGHGLHHMLTTVDYGMAAGINNVDWDAVELPSQFMENWCYHRETLLGMSGHVDTGEPLPDDLYDKLCAARHYRAGSLMLRQLSFGLIDLALHHGHDPDGPESAFDLQRRLAPRTSVMPPLPEDRFLCSFGHIFAGGYAAGYYSYKWAEVLSADAFAAFEEAGVDDPQAVASVGRRYRENHPGIGRQPARPWTCSRRSGAASQPRPPCCGTPAWRRRRLGGSTGHCCCASKGGAQAGRYSAMTWRTRCTVRISCDRITWVPPSMARTLKKGSAERRSSSRKISGAWGRMLNVG